MNYSREHKRGCRFCTVVWHIHIWRWVKTSQNQIPQNLPCLDITGSKISSSHNNDLNGQTLWCDGATFTFDHLSGVKDRLGTHTPSCGLRPVTEGRWSECSKLAEASFIYVLYIHIFIELYICTYVRTYIHTYIHTYNPLNY